MTCRLPANGLHYCVSWFPKRRPSLSCRTPILSSLTRRRARSRMRPAPSDRRSLLLKPPENRRLTPRFQPSCDPVPVRSTLVQVHSSIVGAPNWLDLPRSTPSPQAILQPDLSRLED